MCAAMIYRFKNVDLTEDEWEDLRLASAVLRTKGYSYSSQLLLDLLEKADVVHTKPVDE